MIILYELSLNCLLVSYLYHIQIKSSLLLSTLFIFITNYLIDLFSFFSLRISKEELSIEERLKLLQLLKGLIQQTIFWCKRAILDSLHPIKLVQKPNTYSRTVSGIYSQRVVVWCTFSICNIFISKTHI